LIAAVKQDRRAMGCEKEPLYVDIARDRLAAYADGSLKLRPLGKPVYQPTGREQVSRVPDEWQSE
jgi:adenine-specific DNA-methyltransferase